MVRPRFSAPHRATDSAGPRHTEPKALPCDSVGTSFVSAHVIASGGRSNGSLVACVRKKFLDSFTALNESSTVCIAHMFAIVFPAPWYQFVPASMALTTGLCQAGQNLVTPRGTGELYTTLRQT